MAETWQSVVPWSLAMKMKRLWWAVWLIAAETAQPMLVRNTWTGRSSESHCSPQTSHLHCQGSRNNGLPRVLDSVPEGNIMSVVTSTQMAEKWQSIVRWSLAVKMRRLWWAVWRIAAETAQPMPAWNTWTRRSSEPKSCPTPAVIFSSSSSLHLLIVAGKSGKMGYKVCKRRK